MTLGAVPFQKHCDACGFVVFQQLAGLHVAAPAHHGHQLRPARVQHGQVAVWLGSCQLQLFHILVPRHHFLQHWITKHFLSAA